MIPGHQDIYFTEHGYQVLERLDREAQTYGVSHIQLALSWVLKQPGITSVLIGARKTSHIDQALSVVDSAARLTE